MNWEGKTVVVAGNGPSLAAIPPGRILASDLIIRTNSFFLEEQYHLGKRVDLAMLGGDPRVAPFVMSTLASAAKEYEILGWTARDPRVIKAGHRRLKALKMECWPGLPDDLADMLGTLCTKFQRQPLTGTYAVVLAQALGAAQVIVTGMDLYQGSNRYVFAAGRRQRRLMGDDLDNRKHDARLHNPDLDRALFEGLQSRAARLGHGRITVVGPAEALSDQLDLTPAREGQAVTNARKPARTSVWAGWAGLYPASLLLALRRASAFTRRSGLNRPAPDHPDRNYLPSKRPSQRKDGSE